MKGTPIYCISPTEIHPPKLLININTPFQLTSFNKEFTFNFNTIDLIFSGKSAGEKQHYIVCTERVRTQNLFYFREVK